MSKSAEWDLERKAAIEKLQDERSHLIEIMDARFPIDQGENANILEKIYIIDDHITNITATRSTTDSNPDVKTTGV